MNRICSQLQRNWGKVKVSALCWGPWGKTKFGAGMVTEATEAKFSKYGVELVTAEIGRSLFRYQVANSKAKDDPEIICGVAPWEESEARRGEIALSASGILNVVNSENTPQGDVSIEINVNKNHPYLQDHIIDEEPVLPMAVAMELMAEAVAKAYGEGWQIVEVTDAQLFKGVFVNSADYPLSIKMKMTSHGMDGNSLVKARITSTGDKPVPHYGATIVLAPVFGSSSVTVPEINWKNKHPITVNEAYDKWLFHGKSFQVITSIDEFCEQGAKCKVRTTKQSDLLGGSSDKQWLFDPAIVDATAHMSVLWMAVLRNLFALPVKFGRIVRFAENMPQEVIMNYIVTAENSEAITVDVYFEDDNGQVLMLIESMQHIVAKNHKVGVNKKKIAA
jgi:3-hydroxymyristoyl/3-hydroxydecanoyl-(acyl carrier protein) dehydratase